MNISYSSVREPRWANQQKTAIDCLVKFDHMKSEGLFTASEWDVEIHGREIFRRCRSGEFGNVAPMIEPVDGSRVFQLDHASAIKWPGWREIHDFLAEANVENTRGSMRGIILVWASMIEKLLGDVLEGFLVDQKYSRELVWNDAHSPLGTFSGRIKLSFALGLISSAEMQSCDSIKRIRNGAAHNWQISLSNPEFMKLLNSFKYLYEQHHKDLFVWTEDLEFLTRLVYGGACARLATTLAQRVVEAKTERRSKR